MITSSLKMIADLESELIGGGGTGTGRAVQLDQIQSKMANGMPAPRVFKETTGDANAWGKHVSGTLSKISV